jgi:mono/diheme cytochrome c family protein
MKILSTHPIYCRKEIAGFQAVFCQCLRRAAYWLGWLSVVWCSRVLASDEADFARDVRPIFEKHCYACHGQDKQKSGLRLDIRSEAFKGGDGYGPSIVPNNLEESPLIALVTAQDSAERMPPSGPGLSKSEIDILTSWVMQGANWPEGIDLASLVDRTDHWSFKPLRDTNPPDWRGDTVRSAESQARDFVAHNAIDSFIAARLLEHGLDQSPPAERLTWLRRVWFDLVGLPPSQEAVEHFLNDTRSDSFERAVDALLASPRYGERWGQHWLDVVRYADTDGFEVNTPRANAWPYRDYVIEAFNQDVPYDQFIREQLVGDLLGRDSATGFLVTAAALLPGQIGQDEESKRLARQDELAEIIINTGEAFLGLSIGCARCHDHKFDAIPHRDYYALQAFFSGVKFGERPVQSPESKHTLAAAELLRSKINSLEEKMMAVTDSQATVATDAKLNELEFPPTPSKIIRFTIFDCNRHPTLGLIEPCIDEFEIFSGSEARQNVALASHGTTVTASGSRTSDNHRLEHIHDGLYGNSYSWMSDQPGRGWLQFELPEETEITSVAWSRDRDGQFNDRLATLFSLEVGQASDRLQHIAGVTANQAAELRALIESKEELEAELAEMSKLPMVFAGQFGTPEQTFLLSRGDPERPLEPVAPAVLSAIGNVTLSAESTDTQRRQALADWISCPENPLTARVMVNRLWQWHFGVGLVETASDFGRSGYQPTHPELLDWLAREFIESGWSIKRLHRIILLSATYRQSSLIRNRAQEIDADARWLWRFPARRLEAETIRDTMLSVSGRLNLEMGGPGFDLFQSRGGLNGFPPIESFSGDGLKRMVYAHKIRMERESVFGAFDCPDAGQSTPRRRQSTTPIQALNLFNSRFTIDESEAFSRRVKETGAVDLISQITLTYQLALGRQPDDHEVRDAETVVRSFGLPTLCRAIFNCNEFLFLP